MYTNTYTHPTHTHTHSYLKCICDACEEDVEKRVANSPRYARCASLKQLIDKAPSDSCKDWYKDECELPLDDNYCESLEGTLAWWRNQKKPEPKQLTWDEDGMKWRTYCKQVCASLRLFERVCISCGSQVLICCSAGRVAAC